MTKGIKLLFVGMLVVFLVGCVQAMPVSHDDSVQMVENLVGVWEGSYTARQGETGLTLTVTKENGVLQAVFRFYNLTGRTNAANGSYYMSIIYQNGKYTFRGREWIERPSGYVFLDLEGVVDASGNALKGVTIPGGGSPRSYPFMLTRKG